MRIIISLITLAAVLFASSAMAQPAIEFVRVIDLGDLDAGVSEIWVDEFRVPLKPDDRTVVCAAPDEFDLHVSFVDVDDTDVVLQPDVKLGPDLSLRIAQEPASGEFVLGEVNLDTSSLDITEVMEGLVCKGFEWTFPDLPMGG